MKHAQWYMSELQKLAFKGFLNPMNKNFNAELAAMLKDEQESDDVAEDVAVAYAAAAEVVAAEATKVAETPRRTSNFLKLGFRV